MTIRPSVPEIITVNSETLQTQIRDLLPSQNGFGSELQATNVITPIIDLTAAAEGSGLPFALQEALAFSSQTAFSVANTSTTLANSPGFYRVIGTAVMRIAGSGTNTCSLDLDDGVTTKQAWSMTPESASQVLNCSESFDYIFWLAAGITLSATSTESRSIIAGSIRQVADSTGTLVNPGGYPL